jgi:multicomponent Na+:H+ antiporter subunit D
MRFAFTGFGATLVFGLLEVGRVGLVLASVAMLAGSAVACFQRDLRYLLAWSSVGQMGYIVAGLSLATTGGLVAAYLHLFFHGIIKAALFAAAGMVLLRLGTGSLPALAGLGRRMPGTFAALLLAGLGLIGVPPTAGFVSKWALVQALIDQGQWLVLAAVLASSLLAVVYVGRIVEVGWFRPVPTAAAGGVDRPPWLMVAAGWVLVLLSLYFGIDATWPASLAEEAAAALLGSQR